MNLENISESAKKRPGPKSGAQTPAKPEERRSGSKTNPKGSAGTGKGAPSITFSEKVLNALKNKVKEHNSKYSKKVTLNQLKKVYRRGAGAFSSSHRPGKTRDQWAMARVNMFLKMVKGGKVKEAYRKADQDIARASNDYEVDISASIDYIDFDDSELLQALIDLEKFQMNASVELDFTEAIAKDKENKTLNKPFRTPKGPKKFSVYVKNDKGNIVKVNFGDPNMEIKRDDPDRRKNFRARHQCDTNPGPKWKARYWSCKMWESGKSVTDYTKASTEEWDGKELWDHNHLLDINPDLCFANEVDDSDCECGGGCGCKE